MQSLPLLASCMKRLWTMVRGHLHMPKHLLLLLLIILLSAVSAHFLPIVPSSSWTPSLVLDYSSTSKGAITVFYDTGNGFQDSDSARRDVDASTDIKREAFPLPFGQINLLRLDLPDRKSTLVLANLGIKNGTDHVIRIDLANIQAVKDIASLTVVGGHIVVNTTQDATHPKLLITLDKPLNLERPPSGGALMNVVIWIIVWAALLLVVRSSREIITSMAVGTNKQMHLLALLLALCVIYVSLALTPSHYGMALLLFGSDLRPLMLPPREIRWDEWAVLTPLFQTALRGGFSPVNQISPYHESLKSFWALPILDWSLALKPQLWGFWIAPSAYAYSLYFTILAAAFMAGYTILLRQLGAELNTATIGALCLFFSPFVQVWWTTNAPTFALAPWPLIVFLTPAPSLIKAPVLMWTLAVWVFGLVYPPFIIPAAFVMSVLLVAFRPDALNWSNIGTAALAIIFTAICFLLYFADLMVAMEQTVYPGGRISSGGGFEISKLVAHLLPFFTTMNFVPLNDSNECEIAVVSTYLPLTLLAFVNYRSLAEVLRVEWGSWVWVTIGLTLMLAWMVLPVPSSWGAFLLWTHVPPSRMAWGFGLLLTLSTVILISKSSFEVTALRLGLFCGGILSGWLGSKAILTSVLFSASIFDCWFDLIPIIIFAVTARYAHLLRVDRLAFKAPLLLAAAMCGALTYGTFNPIQQAFAIFDVPETPFIADMRYAAAANPNGWVIFPGSAGALMSGLGISSINHTLTAPQLSFFRERFPHMPEDEFNQVFNRYASIAAHKDDRTPFAPQNDLISVPIEAFLFAPSKP